jgi:calpain-15
MTCCTCNKHGRLVGKDTGSQNLALRVLFFLVNLVLSPILLIVHSIRIYVVPCVEVYLYRVCCFIMCKLCSCSCWKYQDKKFPAVDASLGEFEAHASVEAVKWKHADQICKSQARLFYEGIEPGDISQGQLGDCWLLSALATLAEKPGAIQSCFMEKV